MPAMSRREFVTRITLGSGALAVPSFVISACTDVNANPTESATLDFSSDAGVLNYFYAITQLQADFWARAVANRFPGITTAENTAFSVISSHATNQRNWLQLYQTFGRVSDVLTFDFSTVDFTSRATSMGTALTIEDSASRAYAGGLKYLANADNVVLAAKLASVAARHSATLRDFGDLFAGGATRVSFAGDDIVGATGLEATGSPEEIIGTISKYFRTSLSVKNA
jgi:hypothetical protein